MNMQNAQGRVIVGQSSPGAIIAGQPDAKAPPAPAAPQAPPALPAIPEGGGRLIIDRQGDRTTITSASLPPELLPMATMAKDTALGLMGLLAAIIILGPITRMIARRRCSTRRSASSSIRRLAVTTPASGCRMNTEIARSPSTPLTLLFAIPDRPSTHPRIVH